MSQVLLSIASSTLLTLLLLLTAIGLEFVGAMERYSLRARLPGFLMSAVGTPLSLGLAWQLQQLWNGLGLGAVVVIPLWRWLEPYGNLGYGAQIALLVIVADFLVYWRHRAEHAWFWPIHVVHHAATELHAANDIAHPLQTLYDFALVSVPLSLVQIDGPQTPFVVAGIVLLASMCIHSPVKWHAGVFRRIIVDNRYHRIHHSMESRHFDKNFGILLSIWDHLFGTAYEPSEEWPAVGVADTPQPRSIVEYLVLPLACLAARRRWVPASERAVATVQPEDPRS